MARPTSRAITRQFTPRVKVWVELEGEYVFGYGLSEILRAVERAGSIKEAAAELGKSYRYVWSRIKEAEKALGLTLVDAHVGGTGTRRSFLTPAAEELLSDFMALRERMLAVVEAEFSSRFRTPSKAARRKPEARR